MRCRLTLSSFWYAAACVDDQFYGLSNADNSVGVKFEMIQGGAITTGCSCHSNCCAAFTINGWAGIAKDKGITVVLMIRNSGAQ